MPLAGLGYVLGVSGAKRKAEMILGELEEHSRRRYVSSTHLATVSIGLGRKEEALTWLERAYQEHSFWLINVADDFRFDSPSI
jgi:hypothetical protein